MDKVCGDGADIAKGRQVSQALPKIKRSSYPEEVYEDSFLRNGTGIPLPGGWMAVTRMAFRGFHGSQQGLPLTPNAHFFIFLLSNFFAFLLWLHKLFLETTYHHLGICPSKEKRPSNHPRDFNLGHL